MKSLRIAALVLGFVSSPAFAAEGEGASMSVSHAPSRTERRAHPRFGIELAGSPWAFGGTGLAPNRPDADSMGYSVHFEYQPALLGNYGTIGIGPVFATYPISAHQGLTSNFFSVWALGGAVRYQGRFTPKQILVPSVGFEAERMSYRFTTGGQGALALAGPFVGLEFLLNALDGARSDDLYEASGISHTYLVGEARDLRGSDSVVDASGLSWFFGLRFEM